MFFIFRTDTVHAALTDNLAAYWKLDEASGTRADSVGSSNLTSNNGVTQTTGKLNSAAQFTSASSQYLSVADNTAISVGDIDFTVAAWVYLDSKSTTQTIASHYFTSTNQRGWDLEYLTGTDRFRFTVSGTGDSTIASVLANNFGSPSTGTWYYVVAWHDSVNNTINIQVNNGSVDSAAWSTGVYNSSGPFVIGALSTPLQYLTGKVDSVGFWKKVLSSTERTSLYNAGDGLEYPFAPQDGITITAPVSYQVIQRGSDNTADINISGTYTGSPTAIEASWNGGAYTTIVSSPSGGTYTGTLSDQTAGQGTLTVRFLNDHTQTASKSYVGIGDIFVSAGQSNGSGRAINNQIYTHPTLKAALFGNDDTWKELVDPFDSMSNQVDSVSLEDSSVLTTGFGSAWPLVATHYLEDQNVPVAFIPTNKGGTSISEWLPNASNHGDTTTLYGSMYRRIQAVGGAVKGVLFWQGENDVGGARATYLSRLQSFADSVYADFGVKVVPAQIGPYGTQTATNLNNIRLAQQDAWNAGGTILPGPTLYDVDITDPDFQVHFKTDTEIQTAADRWWAAISKDYFNGPDGRGPRLSSATHNTAKTEIILTFTDDSLPILPATGIDPLAFTVKDNGVAQTVSSVERISNSAIKLTLASPASGTLTVSLGNGDTAKGKVVPTDSSEFNLPAEIFIDQPTTLFDPDTTAPVFSEITPVSTPTTTHTPSYTFSSSEEGTITYGGSCSSSTTSAVTGNNIVTFSSLATGQYADCTITVTDSSGNSSSALIVSTFTIEDSSDTSETIPIHRTSGSIALALRLQSPADCLPGYNFSPSTGRPCAGAPGAVSTTPGEGTLVLTRLLKPGAIGADIKALQQYLNTHGFTVSATGAGAPGHETTLFGSKTKAAVQKFQAAKGLKADGIVGPMTRGYLK